MARKKNIFNGEKGTRANQKGSRVNMGGDDLDLACTGGSLVDQYCHPDSPIMMAGKAVLRLLYGLTRSKPAPKPGFRHRLNILTMSKATLKAMSKIGVDGAPNRTDSKQAGNGPSRRHIQGSKIAKGLQNFQVLVNWDYFNEFFLKKVSQCRKKTEREDPLGFFNIHSVAKLQKIEGGPFVGKSFF